MDIFNNPIAARVRGGTLPGDTDLCATCRGALIRKGSATGFVEVRCGFIQNSPRVPEKLAVCSGYLEKGRMSLHEMNYVAWIIEANKGRIGFLSPEELARRRERGDMAAPPQRPVGF